MAGKWPSNEAEVGAALIQWLRGDGWQVWQEVRLCYGGGTADVVAERGRRIWIIECKRGLGLRVLDQAERWLDYADFVSVATARSDGGRTTEPGAFTYRALRSAGVGWLLVRRPWSKTELSHVEVRQESMVRRAHGRTHRQRRLDCRRELRDVLATHCADFSAAGSANGRVWTPWRRTVTEAAKLVRKNGPMTVKALIEELDHHYASDKSARACLYRCIADGLVEELSLDHSERPSRVVLKTPA